MSSGTELIQDAYRQLGVHSIAKPVSSDSIARAVVFLNGMLSRWLSLSIDLKTIPIKLPGEQVDEPIDARQAIVFNLALLLAPMFDNGKNIVSEELRRNARLTYEEMRTLYQTYEVPDKIVSGTLPRGAGNSRGTLPRIYSGENAEVDNS